MNAIRTNAAAALLGVSSSTLRSWERRYGFPHPERSPGGHRLYAHDEIESLRHALEETHNISSAVAIASERGLGLGSLSRLAAAYASFEEDAAGRVLEESLAVRSIERTIEELLLPAVAELHDPSAAASPEYQSAWRHATGWLSAMKRLGPPASRPEGILLADGTDPFGIDALYAQALEVVLRRAGLRTLVLRPSVDAARLGRAVRAVAPRAIILVGSAGSPAELDALGRLVYAVRAHAEGTAVLDYRGAVPETTASTVTRLGDGPVHARDRLLAMLESAGAAARDLSPRVALRHAGA